MQINLASFLVPQHTKTMKAGQNFLPEELIVDVARRFRALSEPVRLRVLRLLEGGELSVNEVAELLVAGQSNVSRHLQALYDCDLVDRRRKGTTVYYFISDPMVNRLCTLVCDNALQRAHGRLKRLTKP